MKSPLLIFKCLAPLIVLVSSSLLPVAALAATDGAITGTVDANGVAVPGAKVQVLDQAGKVLKEVTSSVTGEYQVFPIAFGDYKVSVKADSYAPYEAEVHVGSGSTTQADAHLVATSSGEMVVEVKARRNIVQTSTSQSSKEITSEQILALPQGENISLPHLLSTTSPGVVQGTFGQTFIRGNHANVQYQIDGIQLPDSQTNSFGDIFTPRNIDHMEVITGGIPAEFGNRLAAVVNVLTKSGAEKPNGEAEVDYGSYNTFEPWAVFGGSNESGSLHYFLSAQFKTSNRGLDTPDPSSDGGSSQITAAQQSSGGESPVHDTNYENNVFAKFDWLADNSNKLTLVVYNNYATYQLPNYTSAILPTDSLFQPGGTDSAGNTNTYVWTPSTTNDVQTQDDAYLLLSWKHTFSEHTFYQQGAYYRYSLIQFQNDETNDLLGATYIPINNNGTNPPTDPASLYEDRHVNNFGIKGDLTTRLGEQHYVKAGYQFQESLAGGPLNVTIASNSGTPTGTGVCPGCPGAVPTYSPMLVPSSDPSTANGLTESAYVQDDYSLTKRLIFNVGLRFDAIQYFFDNTEQGTVKSTDFQFEPRIGANYLLGDTTKLHAYYGRLFQPAPLEDLRDTFVNTGTGAPSNLAFYDIKAEKDDFFEVGVAQQIGDHVISANVYYKNATDLLDDSALLNTSMAAAYNFATGYAYGVELSTQGKIASHWSDYANYSYEIAKGQGADGGLFALPYQNGAPQGVPDSYVFLDHVQIHTLNAGITYANEHLHWTTQALYGSGLRTGPDNSVGMPSHFTMNTTVGYDFKGEAWYTRFKVQADVMNIFDFPYAETYSNGFNGARYAPGREFFVHLSKEI